jgi:aspartate aminotransferase-like enzyme
LAIGQGPLTPKLIRVGHLGWVSDADIKDVVTALQTVMPRFTKGA